jgi:Mg2+ and Co2+ transporter CorA
MTVHWQKFSFAPDVVLQVINGEALILKLQEEEVFSLNETGARVAQLIDEGRSLDAVIDALTDEYATARENIEHEVNDLVQALVSKGLIIRRESPGGE